MRGMNKKGRSKAGPSFAQLHHYLLKSDAWRDLTPQSRAVYIVVLERYNGFNNGFIALSARDAAELAKINKDTASACFRNLVAHGFLECASLGGFSFKLKHASEWRLTQFKCDRTQSPASKAFLRWCPPANDGPFVSNTRSPTSGGHA